MGDMADYVLEQIEDEEFARHTYRIGGMSIYEAYERGIIDELGRDIISGVKPVVCKHCGNPNLTWGYTNNGWRTFEGKNIHKCPKFTTTPSNSDNT